MKKLIALVLFAAMIFALAMPVMAFPPLEITAPKGTPAAIDGIKDDVYSDFYEFKHVEHAEDGAGGKIAVAWDDNYIYCYVEVYDKTPFHDNTTDWQTDNVEFFFDWNNHKAVSDITNEDELFWQARIHSAPGVNDYGVTAHSNGRWYKDADWYDGDNLLIKFKVVGINGKADLSDGYIIEAAFPKAVALTEGKVLGFDATVGDAHDDSSRYSTAMFYNGDDYGMPSDMWTNPSALKALMTLGAVKAAPVAEPDQPAADNNNNNVDNVVVTPPSNNVSTSPTTGDAGIITLSLVMMIAAAGIVIFRKKSAVK